MAHPVAPPVPPVRMDRGTGLDEAAAGLGGFEEELREKKKSRSPNRWSPKKKEAAAKKTVRTVLREKVHRYEESHPEKKKKSRGKRKKRGEGDRDVKKKLSRGDSGASTDSSDESDGGSSDSLFHLPPSRGGAELWRLANKYPSKLSFVNTSHIFKYLVEKMTSTIWMNSTTLGTTSGCPDCFCWWWRRPSRERLFNISWTKGDTNTQHRSPAEVRPHGDVALLSRQSRRRDGGELAHKESYGIREPSDAEQFGRPRERRSPWGSA